MTTRLYFSASVAADVTPSSLIFGWDQTSSVEYRKMNDVKGATALANRSTISVPAAQEALDRVYVSRPLVGAQSISGTVQAIIIAHMVNINDAVNGTPAKLWVCNNAGDSVRGTLLSHADRSESSGTNYPTSQQSRWVFDSVGSAISTVDAEDGDRIVLEVGHAAGGGFTPEVVTKWGEADPDDYTTQGDAADKNPWLEFSQTLIFTAPASDGWGIPIF